MKKTALILLSVFTAGMIWAGNGTEQVNTEKSKVEWLGKKVTGKHYGTVSLESGSLEFADDKLAGGSFVIDMNSIACTDIEDADMNSNLVGHLKSDDFFGVETYPTAAFEITNVEDADKAGYYSITGNMTIKDVTEEITFDGAVIEEQGKKLFQAELSVDRTAFNVQYGSSKFFDGLGDRAINDNFDLTVSMVTE